MACSLFIFRFLHYDVKKATKALCLILFFDIPIRLLEEFGIDVGFVFE